MVDVGAAEAVGAGGLSFCRKAVGAGIERYCERQGRCNYGANRGKLHVGLRKVGWSLETAKAPNECVKLRFKPA